MKYIKGKVRNLIYEGNGGYKVGLFRVKETDDEKMHEYLNKTITFMGTFAPLNQDDTYKFYGEMIEHEKYGEQYKVTNYERCEIEGTDAIIEFLSSSIIKGCGEKTAIKIVETFKEDAINKIKESATNLLLVPGITEKKALKIYESVLKYNETDDLIIYLKSIGFSINDTMTLIEKYGTKIKDIINTNIYILRDIIPFNKLDGIFLQSHNSDDDVRIFASIIEALNRLAFSSGDTYYSFNEIKSSLTNDFNIITSEENLHELIDELIIKNLIIEIDDTYYLKEIYDMESFIARDLTDINCLSSIKYKNLDESISAMEHEYKVSYNNEQKNAIKTALNNRVTIITGGPGTGKTTIINAIANLYIRLNDLSNIDILNDIALLAPTGRASKKMAESTGLPAQTIHRYLKWNKDKNEFQVNEYNKNNHKLIIIDETSMIDTYLMSSLLKGINTNIKLVIVGDVSQLPSVGPGLILNDIIESKLFSFCPLEHIYRQSENSYIPVLAKEIKEHSLSANFTLQKDDYNFFSVPKSSIKDYIKKICGMCMEKGLTEKDIEILAPMYKGENGIDNLNLMLQNMFNPKNPKKEELKYLGVVYRENDKVLQLVNNPDCNVFNGDIGYIYEIGKDNKGKVVVTVNYEGNYVEYNKDDLVQIKHAYAITIHKSQGSEFTHVIMPITMSYNKMLYNKLIYTGVSRAKKSLVIIGEKEAFIKAVDNDYSKNRHTGLLDKLMNKF